MRPSPRPPSPTSAALHTRWSAGAAGAAEAGRALHLVLECRDGPGEPLCPCRPARPCERQRTDLTRMPTEFVDRWPQLSPLEDGLADVEVDLGFLIAWVTMDGLHGAANHDQGSNPNLSLSGQSKNTRPSCVHT